MDDRAVMLPRSDPQPSTATLAVVTPSYRRDWPLFMNLHRSVLLHTAESVKHYVIVPDADRGFFAQAAGPRCVVISEEELYPRGYRSASAANRVLQLLPHFPASARIAAVNLARPFHPIRGWIMQQALKIEACCRVDADVLLVADSDVELFRDVSAASLSREGQPRFYRRLAAVDDLLPEHVRWHVISRKLLGLPHVVLPAPDYVSSFNVWDPNVLRSLLARIEQVTSRRWIDAVTEQRSFSEWTLYGVYVDEFVKETAELASESSMCHSYWGPTPLTTESAAEFVADVHSDDVAILIQSKSGTPMAVRRAASSSLAELCGTGG